MGAKQTIRTQRGLLAAGRMGGFKTSQSVLDTIYGNLGTTLGGGRAALTGDQARLMSALSALKGNQDARSRRITGDAQRSVAQMYGSAISGANAPGQATVATAGKAGRAAVAGQVSAGGILARGNAAAYATLEQGATAAQAGAAGQLADALGYRARNDATLIAQEQFDLQKMRYQNKLDKDNALYKFNLANEAGDVGAKQLVGFADTQVSSLQQVANDLFTKNGVNATGAEILNTWAGQTGYAPGSSEYLVARAVANTIAATSQHNNPDPNVMANNIATTLSGLYPNLTSVQIDSLSRIVLSNMKEYQFSGTSPVELTGYAGDNVGRNAIGTGTIYPGKH